MQNPQYDWNKVDFSKRDALISRELGCSSQAVAQARKRLKKLKPITFYGQNSNFDWDKVDWSQTNKAIALSLGCSNDYVIKFRLKNKKPRSTVARERNLHRRSKYNWEIINWDLANKEIAKIVGCSIQYVALKRHSIKKQTKEIGNSAIS